ncbi:hypothetical protein ACI65C_006509 [Semiaphis heraclei]
MSSRFIQAVDGQQQSKSNKYNEAMKKNIVLMHDPVIGDFFVCTKCIHFMLSKVTADLHRGCKKRLFETFVPEEQLYLCSTCGRFYDNKAQWCNHEAMHKRIGNYDPSRFYIVMT